MATEEVFDFEEQLKFGLNWESELSKRLESVLTQTRIENISFDDNPDMQRNGIDAVIRSETPDFDVKTQSYKHKNTGNLPIETWSVREKAIPGWFYTSKSDLIVWAYENQAGNNLLPTGYFMLKNDWLVGWFNERIDEFREITVANKKRSTEYTTVCRLVPIDEFPNSHLVEFNPTLQENKKTDQYELVEFTSGGGE